MFVEDLCQKIKSKNVDETRTYFLEEIKQIELMSRKHKKICETLNYIEYFLLLASAITGWISIATFSSLIAFPMRITSCVIRLKICAITAGIKKYKSII